MKNKKLLIILIHIIMITQTYFFLPLIPVYAKKFGIEQYLIGHIIFFYNLPTGFVKIYFGYLIDKIGSKKVLFLINILFTGGVILYFFPENYLMLALAQFISGVCRAAFMAATSFYFSELSDDNRGRNLGIRTAGTGLGFFIGPLLGGLVSDYFGYYYIFYILLISFILNFIILYQLPVIKKKKQVINKVGNFFTHAKNLIDLNYSTIIISGFSMAVIVVMIDSYLPLYLNEINISIKLAGVIISMKGISQIIFAPIVGTFSDKYGRDIFIYLGIFITAASILLISFMENIWLLAFTVFLISMGFTILNPILNAMAAEIADLSNRGFSIGVFQASVSFAKTIFALLYGLIYSIYNIRYTFIFSSILLMVSLLIIYVIKNNIFEPLYENNNNKIN